MKTYKCTDGHVTKTIDARSAQEAAETYALVTSTVTVVEVDANDREIGAREEIAIEIE